MKRRTILSALVPIVALAISAQAQAPLATEGAAKLIPAAPAGTPAAAAAAGAAGEKPKRAKGPTEITAMEAMLDNKANLAVFSGTVDVKSPDYTINCDKLTVYLKKAKPTAADVKVAEPKPIGAEDAPDKAGGGEKGAGDKDKDDGGSIDTAIAEGNVKILQIKPAVGNAKPDKYYGVGKKAVFDNAKQSCTLTGWPRVQQSVGGNLTKEIVSLEESCVIVMDSDRIEVSRGRHTTRIIDQSALGEGLAPGPKAGAPGSGAAPAAGSPR